MLMKPNPAPAGSSRELFQVAAPLVLSQGSLSLMYVVDRLFLTWYSPDAMAASLPATLMHWNIMSLALGTALYVNTFVAQYDGAGKPDRVASSVWQGVWFTLMASVAMVALIPLGDRLFAVIGHSDKVRRLEQEFFSILCLGSLPFVLSNALACFFSGRGRTMVVLAANVIICIAAIVLDWLFIFGPRAIDPAALAADPNYPASGVRGAAWANVLASCIGVFFYLTVMVFGRDGRRYQLARHWRFDRELFGRLLRFGFPNGLHLFLDLVCFSVFLMLVGRLGSHELAATNLAFNLNSLAFVPMLGLGTAVMTIVGRRIGEGDAPLAKRTVNLAFLWTSVYMALFAVIYVALPDVMLKPYQMFGESRDLDGMRETVVTLLRFVALYTIFDGAVVIYSSAIRGAGDTRFPVALNVTLGWLLAIAPTWVVYAFGRNQGLLTNHETLVAAWTAVTLYIAALGVGMWLRYRHGPWQRLRVIEAVTAEGV